MPDLKSLIRKQNSVKQKLLNFEKYVDSIYSEVVKPTLNELEVRLEGYSPLLKEFDDNQDKIESICSENDLDTDTSGLCTDANLQGAKLPIIKLKTFSGNYQDWLEFKDTFKSLIHTNTGLSPVLKFHYLRGFLDGTAARVIQSLEFSAQNYTVAWELLCSRFDNNRILVNNHVNAIFNLESFNKESAIQLRQMIDNVSKHLRALQNLGLPIEHWDTLIIHLISSKIDKQTLREWEEYKVKDNLPTLDELFIFLRSKADLLETLQIGAQNQFQISKTSIKKENSRQFNLSVNDVKCNFCKGQHVIYNCGDFLSLDAAARNEAILKLKLCSNCLRTNHNASTCRFGPCRKCKLKHNTLLHEEISVPISGPNAEINMLSNQNEFESQVLLSTVVVKVKDRQNNFHFCRALLDSGAQSNFVTKRFLTKLNLPIISTKISIVGINQVTSDLSQKCDLAISSCYTNVTFSISCFVLPVISDNLPVQRFNTSHWNIPQNIRLADPNFAEPREIDLLIGASLFWDLLIDGKIELGKGLPILQNSKLGWIISGNVSISKQFPISKSVCNFSKVIIPEDEQLKKFWEIEELPFDLPSSQDDMLCESIFQKTTTKTNDGRFIVRIPLKYPSDKLGDSKQTAIKRFYSLERKFAINPNFKKQYKEFIEEYHSLGHMTLLDLQDTIQSNSISYYLPHHGIIRESSLTTKLRVVFDASSPTDSGWSLNNLQYIGPKVQNDIISILLRFRRYTYVVSADVTKMYRQILVHPDDRSLQRILWRENPYDDFSIFELNTVTYGTSSAPYLAIRCLKQLAIENETMFPLASQTIFNDFYVDDLLHGTDDFEELKMTCKQVSSILKSGGFILRKWISNNPQILEDIDDSDELHGILSLGENESSKILGIQWLSNPDLLTFQISQLSSTTTITKRKILSDIARIYDPLGLLSPCVILTKILIQQLWSIKLDRDERIPQQFSNKWFQFRNELNSLNDLQIKRCVVGLNYTLLDVHCFCDASQNAYAACIYIRSKSITGKIQVQLLTAKSKVSPLKSISIPRLELCAALLGARLMNQVTNSLSFSSIKCFFWSDSQVTLWWLNTEPHKLQVFVANRVAKIQHLTNINDWHYINTKQNPADLASRGILPKGLLFSEIWWHGPDFLHETEFCLPFSSLPICKEELPELRKQTQAFSTTILRFNFEPFERFSSINKLKRVTAYCIRFLNNCKLPLNQRKHDFLSVQELECALTKLIKIAQQESFRDELTNLSSSAILNKKHKLSSLSPFIDDIGLLRVGGRLQLSSFNTDLKHPILLSSKHTLTKLIFCCEHIRLLHPGPQLLLATIRQKYWPIGGKVLAKNTVRNCITCFKFKPIPAEVPMGSLPKNRISQSFPFQITGIDYAGPFAFKDRKGRGAKTAKCYICVFVCFSTKAVHLELATELTTENFFACLRRFIARRGIPSHIYSDNGTTFVGAHNELQQLFNFLLTNKEEIVNHVSRQNISWHFIPPYSPNFGGLWEAAVKSTKHHLKRMLVNVVLTYEEFLTLLHQIEAILNSRPLFSMSSDPNDFFPITPSHFLIGRILTNIPEYTFLDTPSTRLSRFEYVQQLMQQFWKRWHTEYISQLHQQYKWKKTPNNLEIGDLVLIQDSKLPPYKWLMGRIHEVCPGPDGITRVACVKTPKGIIKRSTRQLCPLPLLKQVQDI